MKLCVTINLDNLKPQRVNWRNKDSIQYTPSTLEDISMAKNSSNTKNRFSFFNIIAQGKLIWKLFRDPNVSPWVRYGVPLIALAYLVFPADILPDVIPVLGQLDDVAIIAILAQLFIALAPDNIVNMYRQASQVAGFHPETGSRTSDANSSAVDGDVIDTDYQVVD